MELMGLREEMPDSTFQLVEIFESALDAYADRQWQAAQKLFGRVCSLSPQDGPSLLYLKRIADFQVNPPPDGWRGETVFDHK